MIYLQLLFYTFLIHFINWGQKPPIDLKQASGSFYIILSFCPVPSFYP
jgi:hypothetical protein